ncbi:MAG: AAA family ATPase [Helicobacteraceae bacterium]|jgi:hypothetical protein|nr:AAA family ATPase [Helicobacteraceae bacterium]
MIGEIISKNVAVPAAIGANNEIALQEENDNYFITGGAGAGKSRALCLIRDALRERKLRVASLGSTGIAAVNIGGQTIHSFFGFGICPSLEYLIAHDKRNKRLIKKIETMIGALDTILIDEISMVSANLMEMIYHRLQSAGFSGRIVFAGDFYQLPPVEKRPQQNLFTARYAFESEAWRALNPKFLELNAAWRSSDREFIALLSALRVGVLDDCGEKLLRTYASQTEVLQNDPTLLFGRNREADAHNEARLKRLHTEEYRFEAAIEVAKEMNEKRLSSFLRSLNAPLTLKLKVGAPILFIVNETGSFYNGERGVITAIGEDTLIVEKANGETIEVERHSFTYEEQGGEESPKVLASVTQFPVRLAWAITIHKSQGMGILDLAIDLDHLFESGQFYVAIGRAIDPKRLYLQSSFDPIRRIRSALYPNPSVDRFYELERSRLGA